MKCSHCNAQLTQREHGTDEVIIRCRGIILRPAGAFLRCPRCRRDVSFSIEALPMLLRMLPERVQA